MRLPFCNGLSENGGESSWRNSKSAGRNKLVKTPIEILSTLSD